jgi:hypothetical protein
VRVSRVGRAFLFYLVVAVVAKEGTTRPGWAVGLHLPSELHGGYIRQRGLSTHPASAHALLQFIPTSVKSLVILMIASLLINVYAPPHWIAILRTRRALRFSNITAALFDPVVLVHAHVNRRLSYSYYSDLKRSYQRSTTHITRPTMILHMQRLWIVISHFLSPPTKLELTIAP